MLHTRNSTHIKADTVPPQTTCHLCTQPRAGMYARRSSLGADSGRQTPVAASSGAGGARRSSTGASTPACSGAPQSSSSVGGEVRRRQRPLWMPCFTAVPAMNHFCSPVMQGLIPPQTELSRLEQLSN